MLDLDRFHSSHHKYVPGVYSHMVLFVLGYAASLLFRAEKDIIPMMLLGWLSGPNRENGDPTVRGQEVGRA